MTYVDGFLIPVARAKLRAYVAVARRAGRIWKEHGALAYRECVGDDLACGFGLPFPRLMRLGRGQVPVWSYIEYRSRAHRDRVNARVMKDPRIQRLTTVKLFDLRRMAYGGFRSVVSL